MTERQLRPCCARVNRRAFLSDLGMGFTGLALGAMLHRDGVVRDVIVGGPMSEAVMLAKVDALLEAP